MKQKEHRIKGRLIDCNIACKKEKAPERIKNLKKKKIFVGGLTPETVNFDLMDYFGKFGEVKKAYIIKDYITGRSKNFGFVEFELEESAKTAVEYTEHLLNGQILTCTPFKEEKKHKKLRECIANKKHFEPFFPGQNFNQQRGINFNNHSFHMKGNPYHHHYPHPAQQNWNHQQMYNFNQIQVTPQIQRPFRYHQNLNSEPLRTQFSNENYQQENLNALFPQKNYSLFGNFKSQEQGMFCYKCSDNEESSQDEEDELSEDELVKKTIDLIMLDE